MDSQAGLFLKRGESGLMQLTTEQEALVHAQGRIIRVTAYAGTGKTSSLVAWARGHPGCKTLYLAFNKSVQLEARQRFPRWVTPKTGHALAYAAVGHAYQAKLVSHLKPAELVSTGLLSRVPTMARMAWADTVLQTLQAYLVSPDANIGPQHCPLEAVDWQGPFAWADPVRLIRDTQIVWQCMQDPQNTHVGMVHDGYLKLYVLTRPRLPYDAILFDEAQDANPVLLQLIQAQTHAQQIYVGDPYQAIYGWRGAIDAMSQLRPDADLRLTASFRFGSTLAAWATRLLHRRDPALPPLTGRAPQRGHVYAGIGTAPLTVVGRSNSGLFAEAVSWLDRVAPQGLHWVGGIDGYHLDWLQDTARLWLGDPVRHPFLQLFPDFDALQEYAHTVEDVEWQGRCRAVERWGGRLPALIRRVQNQVREPAAAPVHVSTIHKAKGLEWPHVVILNDLAELTPDLSAEDHHLWYVAMTRATQQLGLPDTAWTQLQA